MLLMFCIFWLLRRVVFGYMHLSYALANPQSLRAYMLLLVVGIEFHTVR